MEQEGQLLLSSQTGAKRSRELDVELVSERREKRQKMPRNDEKSNKEKKTMKKKKELQKLQKRLRDEMMKEIKPIAIGSIAMIVSTISNQGRHICTNVNITNAASFLTHMPPPLQLSLVCWADYWTKRRRMLVPPLAQQVVLPVPP